MAAFRRTGTRLGASVVLFIAACITVSTSAWAGPQAVGPLPDGLASGLAAVEHDPPPASLAGGAHFPTSNEIRCHLWNPIIQGRGGVFLGVGTDQNYLMAGWSRPDLLILMDFDQLVVDLHAIYRIAFLSADNPDQFLALWSADNEQAFTALIRERISDAAARDRIVSAFGKWRKKIDYRMHAEKRRHKKLGVGTFLDDPAQYAHIAGLFKNNRVFAFRGDLTGSKTLRSIGEAVRKSGMVLRVLYLSNAERYFDYTADFKQNIAALPFDSRSIVLRTVGYGSWKNGDPFIYIYQDAGNFAEWVKLPQVTKVRPIVDRRVAQKTEYLYTISPKLPEPRQPRAASAKKPPAGKAPVKAPVN